MSDGIDGAVGPALTEPLDTVVAPARAEIEVTRSRFIADLVPVASEDAAADVVAAARREFHDARHHCSAWALGPDAQQTRCNDDGEPGGTAGAPMLAVLQGAELTDVVAVVTRYFGGTLLGAGGLVRAYGDAVAASVVAATRRRRRTFDAFGVRAGHAEAGRLEHRLRRWADDEGGRLDAVTYDARGACLEVVVPVAASGPFLAQLAGSGIGHEVERRGRTIRALRGGSGSW